MSVSALPETPGGWGVIYADPPWAFKTHSGKNVTPHRTKVDHYATMPLPDIKALPVGAVAAKDCVLILWVVDSHIDAALELIEAWGFTLKTRAFTWVKTTKPNKKGGPPRPAMGMGYWTRKCSEICLLATRGKPKRLDASIREVVMEPRREHSRKPDIFRTEIQKLVGGPYLEMFARESAPGWSSWGNETTRFDNHTALNLLLLAP